VGSSPPFRTINSGSHDRQNLEFVVNPARDEDGIFHKPTGFQVFWQMSDLA
jgi:hypothetical protein